MKQLALTLAFVCSLSIGATAQPTTEQPTAVYTVQLGTFDENVKQADFEAINTVAYVHKRDGVVYIGGFANENAALPTLAKMKAKGYDDAFVTARSLKKSQTVHIVQLASKAAGEALNWKSYAKVGDLFTLLSGNQVRIVHGYYTDINDARAKLKEITNMGFDDAFVKTVKEGQLNPVTDFDTGDKRLVEISDEVRIKSVPESYNSATVKRKSAVKLQEALKELGTYGGTIDGQYGKGTSTAYEKALKFNRKLKTYDELSQRYDGFQGWEDVRLLMTMAYEISLKEEVQPITADILANLPDEALSTKEAKNALDWHAATWKSLEKWSATSQYSDQVYTGLKVAYYRSLIHLEDYFGAKGIKGESGTALAVSVLRTMIGENLEGFN
jgi:peptidoglycan hydrolase-like protein with peptidoglycan-binding domain